MRRNELSNPNSPAQTYLQTHILNQPSLCSRARHKLLQCWFWLPHLFTILETILNCLQRWLHFFLGNSSWRSPQPFWGTETENQFAFVAHAFTLSCPTPGPDCPHIYNSGVLAPGGQAPQSPLSSCLFLCPVWIPGLPPNVFRSKVYLKKKKKEEEAREFTSFERLHVWVFAWILAHGSSAIIQPLGHWVFYPCSYGETMCRGVKLCPHSSD